MKTIQLGTIAMAGLFALGLTMGLAQDRDHGREDSDWYQHRSAFYQEQHWRGHLFERVREDLDRVKSTTFPVSGDEFRIVRTEHELDELQNKMASSQYDQRELDDVIHAMQRVVDSNKLSPRERDMLSDDLHRMRDYREHHSDWDRR
ncbi:MAG TPA: hypothetical protein VMH80_23945 [Bryobacteraceae bacterium]|nr:hypothetical protein [Bryobacteraceae bacterium]